MNFRPNIHGLMDREGRLVVSGLESRVISRYNRETASFEPLVTLNSNVKKIFSDWRTDWIYALLQNGGVVYFDPAKQTEPVYMSRSDSLSGDEFGFPISFERLVLHEQSQTLVAIVRKGGRLAFYDLVKNTGTFFTVQGAWTMRIPPGNEPAIVCNRDSNNLSVADLSTGRFLRTLPVQREPADIRFRPNGQQGVVFDPGGNAIGVLDVATLELLPIQDTGIPDDLLQAEPRTLAIDRQRGPLCGCDSPKAVQVLPHHSEKLRIPVFARRF